MTNSSLDKQGQFRENTKKWAECESTGSGPKNIGHICKWGLSPAPDKGFIKIPPAGIAGVLLLGREWWWIPSWPVSSVVGMERATRHWAPARNYPV